MYFEKSSKKFGFDNNLALKNPEISSNFPKA
jgi:hypothetical protein